LGLAISRNIIRAHNGDIVVESQPGKGSVFTIKLPLAEIESGACPM
jgi:signal transduction histidine kinase